MRTYVNIEAQTQRESDAQAMPSRPARYARFGKFVIDMRREELYEDGQRVRIQAKVYQTLMVLLDRAGEIVTREEVRLRIWPESSLANLDANVNTAMNKLRQLLGDSSDHPTFIETIPRRGYCFIEAVEFSEVLIPRSSSLTENQATSGANLQAVHAAKQGSILRYIALTPFRLISLVLAGMLVGALLFFVWSFVSNKNHRNAKSGTKNHVALSADSALASFVSV